MEICRNQQWGRVCDDQWDERESAVCVQTTGILRRRYTYQWRIQDLKKGGARPNAREARAKNFSHAPKISTTPPN